MAIKVSPRGSRSAHDTAKGRLLATLKLSRRGGNQTAWEYGAYVSRLRTKVRRVNNLPAQPPSLSTHKTM